MALSRPKHAVLVRLSGADVAAFYEVRATMAAEVRNPKLSDAEVFRRLLRKEVR